MAITYKPLPILTPAPLFDEVSAFDEAKHTQLLMSWVSQSLIGYDFKHLSVSLKSTNSKWRVSSALQKSIRRGSSALADQYAQALIHGGESSYFWTRIPVIVLEDIGPGNARLCAITLMLSRFKTLRDKFQEDRLASWLCHSMANSSKSRAYCDLMCSALFDPMFKIKGISEEFDALRHTVVADMDLLGLHEGTSINKNVKGFMEGIHSSDMPHDLQYTILSSNKKSVYGLQGPIKALHDLETAAPTQPKTLDECSTDMGELLCGLPEIAYDNHTLEGKKALAYLYKMMGFGEGHPLITSSKALAIAVFQCESALLHNRMVTPPQKLAREGNDHIEFMDAGIPVEDHEPVRQLVRSEEFVQKLSKARHRVVAPVS